MNFVATIMGLLMAAVTSSRVSNDFQFVRQAKAKSMAGRKYFSVNTDIQSSWFRAVGHCSARDGMRLATFDSLNQYKKFIAAAERSSITGDFWIGVTKLGEDEFNFFPNSKSISEVHPEGLIGTGDCAYLRLEGPSKVKWSVDECNSSDKKYYICENIPSSNFHQHFY